MSEPKGPALQVILDLIKGSAATAALFLAFVLHSLFGMLPGLFTPAVGIYYGIKRGRWIGIGVVLLAAAALALLSDPTVALAYLLQAGVLTLVLPEFVVRRFGGARSVVYAVAANLVLLLVVAGAYGFFTGTDLHLKVQQGVNASIVQSVRTYEKLGVKGDELKSLRDSMQQAASLVVIVYPALVTVALGIMAALNLALVSRVAARFRLPIYLGEFRKYRNPEPMIWLLIVAGFALLLPQKIVYLGALNVTIVLCALYTVQGFAVIGHLFARLAVPSYARIILCLLLIFQPFLTLAVAALGIFDLWGDFRSPSQKTNL